VSWVGAAGWAFISAAIFALGTVLQQKGAMEAPLRFSDS